MRAELGRVHVSEAVMRSNVVKWLKCWHAVAVENSAYPGTPDVNYSHGLIELKYLSEWPVRETTPVFIPHFSPQQRLFLRTREQAGGEAWLLLQVRREWLLYDGETAAKYVGRVTYQKLIYHSHRYTDQGMTKEKMLEWLRPPRYSD